jgi:hypothetical protein
MLNKLPLHLISKLLQYCDLTGCCLRIQKSMSIVNISLHCGKLWEGLPQGQNAGTRLRWPLVDSDAEFNADSYLDIKQSLNSVFDRRESRS